MMLITKPPYIDVATYRSEHIGSLLKPAGLFI